MIELIPHQRYLAVRFKDCEAQLAFILKTVLTALVILIIIDEAFGGLLNSAKNCLDDGRCVAEGVEIVTPIKGAVSGSGCAIQLRKGELLIIYKTGAGLSSISS